MSVEAVEQKLFCQLKLDRTKPGRRREEGGVTIVSPSGTAVGLAIAIEHMTGEDASSVIRRVGETVELSID